MTLTEQEDRLRGIALADLASIRGVLGFGTEPIPRRATDAATRELVALAAIVATGAPTITFQWRVETALAAGATVRGMAGVVVALSPVVGLRRTRDAAEKIADALRSDADARHDFVRSVSEGPFRLFIPSA